MPPAPAARQTDADVRARYCPRAGRRVAGDPVPVRCHAFAVPVEPPPPPRRTRRVALPRGHIASAAGLPSADQGRQRGAGRRPGQAAREVVGGWPSPARSWRSSSEAAWLETPRRARSASRVIGCPCCPGARRRPAAGPSGAPGTPRPGTPPRAVVDSCGNPARTPRPPSGDVPADLCPKRH